jgi:hypothetical protein
MLLLGPSSPPIHTRPSRSTALPRPILSYLQPLLAPLPLLIPLPVNHLGEGVLVRPRDGIRAGHQARQEQPSGLPVPDGGREERERRAVVHGRVGDVERERRHGRVHEDAEVVAQVRARYAERVHGRQHERVACQEERDGRVRDRGVGEERGRGLVGEGFVVAVRVGAVSFFFLFFKFFGVLSRMLRGGGSKG